MGSDVLLSRSFLVCTVCYCSRLSGGRDNLPGGDQVRPQVRGRLLELFSERHALLPLPHDVLLGHRLRRLVSPNELKTFMFSEVRMAERSKALRSGRSPPRRAWVRIPLLTTNVLPVQSMSVCDFPGLRTCDGAGQVNNKFGHFASVCPIFSKLSGNWVEMSAVGQD